MTSRFRYRPDAAAFVLVLLLTLVLACGGAGGGGDASSDGGSDVARFLSLGSAPPGGAFFVVGGALSETLNEFAGANGWEVTSEATKGSQENIRRLARGELDLALANSAISYFAARGTEGWDQAYDIRAVMTLAPNVAMFITPASSDVVDVASLAGKRVVLGPAGAGFEYFLRPILAEHGVTYDDLTALNNTQAGAVDMLADGAAEAAFLGGAVPTASITQATSSQNIRFVPYGEPEMEALIDQYPFFRPATIPPETYRNQSEAYSGLDVGSMHLITSANVSEETIYQVTKTLYENAAAVIERHPAGRAINERNAARDTGVEFHPGAVRFYREIGLMPADPGAAP